MVDIELDVSALEEALIRADDELDEILPEALELTGDLIAARAKTDHDYKDRTGLLSNSILSEGVTADGLEVVVSAGAPYAAAIEYGAQPHRIEPRHRTTLRIPTEGGYIFRKGVNHPGNRPYEYLQNALDAEAGEAEERLEAALDLALHRAGLE